VDPPRRQPTCTNAFHVTCGLTRGLQMTLRSDGIRRAYCATHSASRAGAALAAMAEGNGHGATPHAAHGHLRERGRGRGRGRGAVPTMLGLLTTPTTAARQHGRGTGRGRGRPRKYPLIAPVSPGRASAPGSLMVTLRLSPRPSALPVMVLSGPAYMRILMLMSRCVSWASQTQR